MRRSRVILASLVVLLALGTWVFAGTDAARTLTVATSHDPPRLDPAIATSWESGIVTYNIYETLLDYDLEDFSIKPKLAEEWEISADGESAVFYLQRGVKFHDGTPFNAEAVRFSFERMLAIDAFPATFWKDRIENVEAVDDYTIKFTVKERWAFWEDAFATRKGLSIVSPSYVKAHATDDDPWAKEWMHEYTCGTGAYMVEEWVHGQYVKLVKFEDYWEGWTGREFETVFVKIVAEPVNRKLQLEKGEVDIALEIVETDIPLLEATPGITVEVTGGFATLFIPMKCHREPLNNKTLRKAITYAINYDEVLKAFPYAVQAQGPTPRGLLGHDYELPIYPYDPQIARLLLEEAGYSPGELKLELTYVAGIEWERKAAVIVQQNLVDIGIDVKLIKMPWATLFPLMADPDKSPQMQLYYANVNIADPGSLIWEVFSPEALGPGGFNNGYDNPRVGELLDQSEATVDREERAKIYKELQRIIVEDVPAVFVWELPYVFIYRSDIKGVTTDRLFQSYYYYNLYRE